jgi:hypothetical protein
VWACAACKTGKHAAMHALIGSDAITSRSWDEQRRQVRVSPARKAALYWNGTMRLCQLQLMS